MPAAFMVMLMVMRMSESKMYTSCNGKSRLTVSRIQSYGRVCKLYSIR